MGAYALDAITAPPLASHAIDALAAGAESFLLVVLAAESRDVEGVGAGLEIHLRSDDIDGHALIWDNAVVHLSAFPSSTRRWPG